MRVITKEQKAKAKSHLLYGETQTGKTTLIGLLARAHYNATGKITRLILCDEGGPSAIQPEIDAGIVEVVDLVGDSMPQSNLMLLAAGKWPGPTGVIDQKSTLPNNIGIIALDSLSSAAALVMNFFITQHIKISQEVVAPREEQGLKFGVAAPSHYGAVHGFILQLITQLSSLPVDMVLFTALEAKSEDQIDKQPTLGPAIIGKALTGVIPSRMNRILHLEIVPSADRKTRQYRIYFKPHVDQILGRVWPANLRLPLPAIRGLDAIEKYSKGFIDFQTGEELLELFATAEKLVEAQAAGPAVVGVDITEGPVVVTAPATAVTQPTPATQATQATQAQKVSTLLNNKGILAVNKPGTK